MKPLISFFIVLVTIMFFSCDNIESQKEVSTPTPMFITYKDAYETGDPEKIVEFMDEQFYNNLDDDVDINVIIPGVLFDSPNGKKCFDDDSEICFTAFAVNSYANISTMDSVYGYDTTLFTDYPDIIIGCYPPPNTPVLIQGKIIDEDSDTSGVATFIEYINIEGDTIHHECCE